MYLFFSNDVVYVKFEYTQCSQLSNGKIINTTALTYAEQRDVVADEVTDHANLLWGLSASLEQAGGEDGGQFFTRHVVEVGTLLNPESQGEACLEIIKRKTCTQYLHTEKTNISYRL